MQPMSEVELRSRLDRAGYDVEQLTRLGKALDVDLLAILAAWAHIIVEVAAPPAPPSLWQRLRAFLNGA